MKSYLCHTWMSLFRSGSAPRNGFLSVVSHRPICNCCNPSMQHFKCHANSRYSESRPCKLLRFCRPRNNQQSRLQDTSNLDCICICICIYVYDVYIYIYMCVCVYIHMRIYKRFGKLENNSLTCIQANWG